MYQFSHALPLYEKFKGTFVVRDFKNYIGFKKYMSGMARHNEKTFMSTPEIRICHRKNLHKLDGGILIFFANSIMPDKNYNHFTTIFYEHGSSDKKYSGGRDQGLEKIKKYDYIFLWGPKNKQKIEDMGLKLDENKLLRVGGFRFDKYLNAHMLKTEQIKKLKIKNIKKRNILYAPTWRFGNGTLKKYGAYFISRITQDYNLIIRPHSHEKNYGKWLYFVAKLKGIKDVYFSQPANIVDGDILFDFAVSDMLISDVSSVVYEYLITQKPILIVNNNYDNKHQMSDNLNIYGHVEKFDEGMDINDSIKNTFNNDKSLIFNKLLHHCFYSINESATDKAVAYLNTIIEKDNNLNESH